MNNQYIINFVRERKPIRYTDEEKSYIGINIRNYASRLAMESKKSSQTSLLKSGRAVCSFRATQARELMKLIMLTLLLTLNAEYQGASI